MRRESSILQEEKKVMELAMNVSNNDNSGIRKRKTIVNFDAIWLLVKDLGSGEDERVEDRNRQDGWQI